MVSPGLSCHVLGVNRPNLLAKVFIKVLSECLKELRKICALILRLQLKVRILSGKNSWVVDVVAPIVSKNELRFANFVSLAAVSCIVPLLKVTHVHIPGPRDNCETPWLVLYMIFRVAFSDSNGELRVTNLTTVVE
jgi:hypothetical protein